MNMFEEAERISSSLTLKDMTQKKLAGIMGVSQPYIANKVRLLDFSQETRKMIIEAKLSERHARTILRLPDESMRIDAIRRASEGQMNVSRCEIMVDCMLDGILRASVDGQTPAVHLAHFEKSLESSLNLLKQFGFFTRMKREKCNQRIYYTVTIE